MKRVFSYLITSLFVLGFALGAVGCSGDLTDYGKDGGAMQSYQWYQKEPRNKAAPVIPTDTEEHYWLIGDCSPKAPSDSWAFTKQKDGANAGKWTLTFKPKKFGLGWGGNGATNLVFCIAGPLTKSAISDWPPINTGNHRYTIDENNEVSIGLNDVTKLTATTNPGTKNFKVTGLNLKSESVEDDSDEYTCVLDDSSGSLVFVMVPGGADDKISTDPPVPTYLTANFEGKPYSVQLVRGEVVIEVIPTSTTSTLYLSWKDKNYKGTITLGTEATLSEDTTQVGSSLTGLEATKKYKITFNAKDESAPKVTVKKLVPIATEKNITICNSNIAGGPSIITWGTPDGDGVSYATIPIASGTTLANWGTSSLKMKLAKNNGSGKADWGGGSYGLPKDGETLGNLKLNSDWVELSSSGDDFTVTEVPDQVVLKQDYILAFKSDLEKIYVKIAPVWNFMIPNACVTEIDGEGSPFGGQNYPAKASADDMRSYKFTVKDNKCDAWGCADFIPFAILNVKGLKSNGDWDTDGDNTVTKYWKGDVTVGTNSAEATGVSLVNNVDGNKGINSATVGDTLTINIKLTKSSGTVTAAKAWITKE